MGVDVRCNCQSGAWHPPRQPKNLIYVMDRHVGQNPATLVSVWCGTRILERRVDLEDPPNHATIHETLGVLQGHIESSLKSQHQGVRVVAIQLRGKFAI